MAEIYNIESRRALRAKLEGFTKAELIGQQLSQQGAIHALTFLLDEGCSRETAAEMLESLRANMALVVEVAERKGYARIFDDAPDTKGNAND